MAKLIEFCGAPGVGKSTVYHAVSNSWKDTNSWIPAHKVYPRKEISHPIKRLVNFVFRAKNPIDDKAMRKAGSRFIALHKEYIEDCWSHLAKREKISVNKSDQRFEKATHIFKMIQRVQSCREAKVPKTVLLEEGLINGVGNALHRSEDAVDVSEDIQTLYNKLPLPEGIVFFEAEPETVVQRLRGRKRFVPSLENLSQGELLNVITNMTQVRKNAVEIYERKGLPVLWLNATDPVAQNAKRTIEFLERFN